MFFMGPHLLRKVANVKKSNALKTRAEKAPAMAIQLMIFSLIQLIPANGGIWG